MRWWGFVLSLLAVALFATGASANLKKYFLQRIVIVDSPNVSPAPDLIAYASDEPGDPRNPPGLLAQGRGSTALIDVSSEPNPVLKKILAVTDRTVTVDVPGLAGSIFVSNNTREGPPSGEFTGTGTTANGSTIAWGVVTGWSVTGTFFCNSVPDFICSLAMSMDETSTEARFNSDFYDLGTWFFHATGFTAIPHVNSYNTNDFSNTSWQFLGEELTIAATPALPVLGVALLGGSLLLGGAVALRRSRK